MSSKKKARDPIAPKRNQSAYLLYQNAMRETFRLQNPGMTFGQVRRGSCFFSSHVILTNASNSFLFLLPFLSFPNSFPNSPRSCMLKCLRRKKSNGPLMPKPTKIDIWPNWASMSLRQDMIVRVMPLNVRRESNRDEGIRLRKIRMLPKRVSRKRERESEFETFECTLIMIHSLIIDFLFLRHRHECLPHLSKHHATILPL